MDKIIQQLTNVNDNILLKLKKINDSNPTTEDFHILVLELQSLIEQREGCLKTLVSNNEFIDRPFLMEQFNLGQTLIMRATKVMEDCRTLVQVDNNAKRQIKAYQAIESNR